MDSISSMAPLAALSAVAFALQRLADVVEATWNAAVRDASGATGARKTALFAWAGIGCGVLAGWWLPILAGLGYAPPPWLDVSVTALAVSGGSEWFNALVKLTNHAKQQRKEEQEAARAERALTQTVAAGVVSRESFVERGFPPRR